MKCRFLALLAGFVMICGLLLPSCGGGGGGGGSTGNVPPQEVIDISGPWNYTNTASVTFTVDGEPPDTQNSSGSGAITIHQDGTSINWSDPVLNELRSGTIVGDTVTVSGKFVVPLVGGVNVTQNTYTSTGKYTSAYSNNKKIERIEMDGTGNAAGTYQGIGWSATGTDHLVLTREVAARASVSARIARIGPVKNEGYKLQLIAEAAGISSGTVTGPGIGTLPLQEPCPWGGDCRMATKDFGLVKPAPGDSYLFSLRYTDGSTETPSDTVYDLGVGFPTLIDPTNGEVVYDLRPLFSWAPPASGCVSQYRLAVYKESAGNNIWSVSLPPTATSSRFNFNLGATENLAAGQRYNWRLQAFDDCANQNDGRDNYTQVDESFRVSDQTNLLTGKAMVSVRIQRRPEGYRLDSIVNGTSVIPIVSATVSGPDIPTLPLSEFCWLEGCSWNASQFFGQTKPTPGNVYTFTVSFADGSTEVLQDAVSDLGVGFPVPISPANGATVQTQTPAFSWSPPTFGCVAWYHLIVNDATGASIWAPHLSSGTTSVVFNFDGRATRTLSPGGVYNWTISAFDDCSDTNDGHDNFSSATGGSFTVQ